jgi:hypothetical protein
MWEHHTFTVRCAEVANFTTLIPLLLRIPHKLSSRLSFTKTLFSQNIVTKFLCNTNGIVAGHTPVPHKFKLVLEQFLYGNSFYSLDEYFELQKC